MHLYLQKGTAGARQHQLVAVVRGSGKDWTCNCNFEQAEMGKRHNGLVKDSGQSGS